MLATTMNGSPTVFDLDWSVAIYESIDGARTEDRAYYLNEAAKASGLIIEAACGSGRLLLPILEAGHDIVGFDTSRPMITKLKQRLGSEANRVWHGSLEDIATFPYREPASLIFLAFNSFLHLLTQPKQLAFLRSARELLKPGGRLILDIINPFVLDLESTMRKSFEATWIDPATDEQVSIWRWFTSNPIEQTATYHREYRFSETDLRHSEVNFRWVYPQEMQLLLCLAGFSETRVFGGFEREGLMPESEIQLYIAQR